MMTKKNHCNETNEITYYCSLHRTTIYSAQFDKNNKKKKICLCNGKIIYPPKPIIFIYQIIIFDMIF